jgi:hypothetical protein
MISQKIERERGITRSDDERVIDSHNVMNGIAFIYAKTMNENYIKSGKFFQTIKS